MRGIRASRRRFPRWTDGDIVEPGGLTAAFAVGLFTQYDPGRSVCCQGRRWATWAAGGLHDHRPGRPLVPGGRPVQHRPAERVIDRVLAHEGIVRFASVIALATQVPCRVLPLLGSVTGSVPGFARD